MKVLLCATVVVFAMVSLGQSEDIENEIEEKRFLFWKSCKTHKDCPSHQVCQNRFFHYKYCQTVWCKRRKCPSGSFCNKVTCKCSQEAVRYCSLMSDCDRSTECCWKKRWSSRGYCKKATFLGIGQRCCLKPRTRCSRCSNGLTCQGWKHSYYGKCRMMPTTAPPPTEEPGSGEMDDGLMGNE